ncbi:GntR family transcriptional regulator [Arthrobacter sp. zg-ZUI100]|uniref:GntR family transcriptional regulator n=1 Tax=Arthrobacter jiangjiafuii TaxID=2817475 RepID=UPI001AEE235D|nr:GntR family transcriptional regulator [Arthrobacter jiangjiafuii]MBP3037535.1 GntR family transcriptional regulator [Arthrobacter jiangjiafuii]MBP3037553.1 GntR family transcriptional regulator [Arthrobacter jiangjiafuii]
MPSSPVALSGLSRNNLREQAVAALRVAVTTGELTQGKHLVETELSETLGISRGTLREALRQLQQEGLVTADDRGHLRVRHLNAREIREIFEVRAALESLAAERLSSLPDRAAVVNVLSTKVLSMESARTHSLEESIETDLDFHRAMITLADNSTLTHQWQSLEGSIRMSIMFSGVDRAVGNMTPGRHQEIVEAIESGHAATARNVTIEHMNAAVRNLTE